MFRASALLLAATVAVGVITRAHAVFGLLPLNIEEGRHFKIAGGSRLADSKTEEFILRVLAEHKVVIFSKSFCPYCLRAKNIVKEMGMIPHVVELDQHDDGPKIQDHLLKAYGVTTVPQVFVGGDRVGGSDDLIAAQHSGKLKLLMDRVNNIVNMGNYDDL